MTPESVKGEAQDGIEKYRRKWAVIKAMGKLDCVEDVDLIEAIRRSLPAKVWETKKRKAR